MAAGAPPSSGLAAATPGHAPGLFQELLDAAPDAMVIVGPDGRIVLVNTQTEHLFGYPRGELLGQEVELLIPGRFRSKHTEHRAQYFHDPRVRPMGTGFDLFGRRKDGSEFPVEVSLSPIQTGEGLLVTAAIRDTTERRKAEERFRGLLESAPDAMVIVEPTGRIVLANSQTERLFGYTREELLGREVEVLIPDRLKHVHNRHRAQYFDDPRVRPMGAGLELHGRRKDGSEFPVEVSLSPMRTDEGVWVTAAVRDTTDRKQAEAALLASLKEKEVLLKEVHHRVKNNLQIIASLLNLQSDFARDPVATQMLQENRDRVHSMALVHEKLYQSKDLSDVAMGDYLADLAVYLRRSYTLDSDRVQLELDLAKTDVHMTIDAAIHCGLIVNELLANSLKHAFPGDRRGTVRLGLHRSPDGMLCIRVADDGVGFPSEVDFRTTESMGFKLVMMLVDQLDGSIELHRDGGTAFEVAIPVPPHRGDPG